MSDPLQQIELVEQAKAARERLRVDPRLVRMMAQGERTRRDREQGRMTLERMRFNHYVRCGTLSDWMQRTGNWFRTHLPGVEKIRFRY